MLSLGAIGSAFADAGERYKQQAAQFEKMLDKAAETDGSEAAKKDIEQARKWLENAKVLLAKGNNDAAANLLRRVKFSVDLVGALVRAGNIQHIADEQEAAYYTAKETQIPELEAEVEELKQQKKKLERQIKTMR